MASIQSRKRPDGSVRYYVSYRGPDHKQHTKGYFKRKGDAAILRNQIEMELRQGDWVDPSLGDITIGNVATVWLDGKHGTVKEKQYNDLEAAYRNHVEPVFGNRKLNSIRKSEIQSWVASMGRDDEERMNSATTPAERRAAKAKSPSVIIRAYGVLKGIYELAQDDGLVRRIPTDGVKLPKRIDGEQKYLTIEQLFKLADNSGTHRTLVLVLGLCGLRFGEAAALRVSDINIDARRIRVSKSWTRSGDKRYETTTKTGEKREVPIPEIIMPDLIETIKGKNNDDLVFTDDDGERIREQVASKRPKRAGSQQWFGNALAAAGLPPMRVHDLRHTAASIAISSGANVKAVQRMMGHRDATMTLKRYAHLFDTDLDRVAEDISAKASSAGID